MLNEVRLELVTFEERTKLENLITLYLHDLSEFADDLKINIDGKFEYGGLELYFSKEDLKPFFIIYKEEVVGFLLFNSGKYVPRNVDYSVHEVFILKGFRKKGICFAAIKEIFALYKGRYKIEQLEKNKTAIDFWRKLYKTEKLEYSETKEKIDELVGYAQIFNV